MNTPNHAPHSIFSSAFNMADNMEPLKTIKDPSVAAACGAAFGGIGLGLYLQSWRDFYIPFAMLFFIAIIGIPTGEMLTLLTPIFWGIYGYRRVTASNRKLGVGDVKSDGRSGGRIVEAKIVTAKPPLIQIPNRTQAPVQARLRQIDDLFQQGILTAAERNEKRRKILGEI